MYSSDGHLGWLHILHTLNCVTGNMDVLIFYCLLTLIPLGISPWILKPDNMVVILFIFCWNSILSYVIVALIYVPFFCPSTSTAFVADFLLFLHCFILLLFYWGNNVACTKGLTIYHSWIHPLHHSPLSPLSPFLE
jgi:hypothetical protein